MNALVRVMMGAMLLGLAGVDFLWAAPEMDGMGSGAVSKPAYRPSKMTYEEFRGRLRQQGLFDSEVMIPMRDGVRLAATVFKPLIGSVPTVLVRTPYGRKNIPELDKLQLLVLTGYSLVFQDTRGRYDSEGEPLIFLSDGWGALQDGYDTIEWIAAQKWNNGKVGMWGHSALGILSGLAAGAVPPHLTCQVIGFAATRGYEQIAYSGGVYRQSLVDGWLMENEIPQLIPVFRAHPVRDEFWAPLDVASRHEVINVPTLFVGGFYDCFQEGTLDGFVGRQTQGAEGARGRQRLIIGPWTHVNEFDLQQGQLRFPANSEYATEITDTIAWFDYWLKGSQNGVMDQPAVKYYLMGDTSAADAPGNVWKTSDSWPPASQPVRLYLGPGGTLSVASLSESWSGEIMVEPGNPVPTLGGMNLEANSGPWDQRPLESRPDVLVFSTDPLPEPVEVTGRITAVIYAESNLTDNDLAVRLTDVYPDGRSMLVCDGIRRASYRESLSHPTPITPGEVIPYEIDLWSTSLVFNTGHRIRVIVANTNAPRFEPNPLYQPLGQNGHPATAVTRVHAGPDFPSHILLPVVSGLTEITGWSWF
ncbi:MAG: CocE/NonD family hydrolase [Candidatus Omnitrophica bacterium]|nr:CocE/NonD family hydrolase [Candidatus Omnitrophota bacterium]